MLKKIKEHPIIIFLTLFIAIGIPLFQFITGKNSIPELLPKETTISTPKSEPQTIINIDKSVINNTINNDNLTVNNTIKSSDNSVSNHRQDKEEKEVQEFKKLERIDKEYQEFIEIPLQLSTPYKEVFVNGRKANLSTKTTPKNPRVVVPFKAMENLNFIVITEEGDTCTKSIILPNEIEKFSGRITLNCN